MKKIHILLMTAVVAVLSSCYSTRTTVGDFNKLTDDGDTNVGIVSKTKQCYVIANLVPLSMKHAETPPSVNCQIVTKFNPLDMLVSTCTGGLFSMKTIKVYGVASEGYEPFVKEPNPVIDNGLQYEIEGAVPGGSVAISYKFAKRFSLGVGYSVIWEDGNFLNQDIQSPGSPYKDNPLVDISKAFFFTGQIRPWNKFFSPILGADLGWRSYNIIGRNEWVHVYDSNVTRLYVKPYGGVSFRLGSNCYLSLKAGFNLVLGGVKPQKDEANYRSFSVPVDYPKIKLSTLYYGINFTHTLPIGHGLHEKAAEKVRNVINREK